MEGQNLDYFPALVNAYGVDHFSISGKGTINGNGLKYWEAFWQRRKENPKCTNLEVSRPRLIFIRDCNDVQLQDVKLINSGFWTSHFYKCTNVKIIDLYIYSPLKPIKAPSTDAIDIDACTNVHIKGCYLSVNDDAIALKGGKGPWADTDKNNGANENILIENCEFGFCHSSLTLGSESIHDKNIWMRNCKVNGARRLLWLKMRPDTPQQYEYVTVENISGNSYSMLDVNPWTQFFDLKGRTDLPVSFGRNITLRNIELKCEVFFDVNTPKNYTLSNFSFENLKIESRIVNFNTGLISGVTLKNVTVLPIQRTQPLKEQPLE
jgi:polygalacturonase